MFNIMSHTAKPSKYTRRYHPRHPLAQYAVNQIDTLKLCSQDIVKAMGYPLKHTIPACERLRHVLSSKHLGLDGSYIDKHFTADEFLTKLFMVLEIPYEPFAEDIAKIKYDLAHGSQSLPSYSLQAKIAFEFDGANWLARSSALRLACIRLPDDFAELAEAERHLIVKESIREHYQRYEGGLPFAGVIEGYELMTEQNNKVVDSLQYRLPKSSSV